jgi:hypothetical protein
MLEETCFQAEPESASCVQRFDDSLNVDDVTALDVTQVKGCSQIWWHLNPWQAVLVTILVLHDKGGF